MEATSPAVTSMDAVPLISPSVAVTTAEPGATATMAHDRAVV